MQSFGKRANADFGALCLSKKDDQNQVKVNIIPDIDAFSLTAVGFGLIAFNFFVLANVSASNDLARSLIKLFCCKSV